MDFATTGKTIWPGRVVDLLVEDNTLPGTEKHGTFRMCILSSGSLLLRVNGMKMLVESPACLCLNNGDELSGIEAENVSMKTIHFKPLVINSRFGDAVLPEEQRALFSFTENQDYIWLESFIYNDDRASRYVKLGPSSLKKILSLCDSLEEQLTKQPDFFWPCRARSFFLEIIYSIHHMQHQYEGFKNKLDKGAEGIEAVLLYIHSFYNEKITLGALVERFAVNRTKLNDMFLSATGQTVINYLIEVRIKLACLILRDTMRPVKEIAWQTGFSDLSHFGRTFRKHINCSPQEYRTKYNWMLA